VELLALALSLLPLAMLVVLVVGFLLVGARRWVRRGILAMVLVLHADIALVDGWLYAAGRLAAVLGIVVALGVFSVRTWRAPRVARYAPATPDIGPPWPPHAVALVERWTRELQGLGFEVAGDVWTEYRVLGSYRNPRLRLFRHASEPVWAAISAHARPKALARAMLSKLADGRLLETCDRVSDRAVTADDTSVRQRTVTTATVARMLEVHRAKLATLGPARVPSSDVVAEMASAREAWLAASLTAKKVYLDGDNVALTWGTSFRAVPRSLAAWLD
jgi:hypothetical protein